MLSEMKPIGKIGFVFETRIGQNNPEALSLFRKDLKDHRTSNSGLSRPVKELLDALIEFTMGASMLQRVAPGAALKHAINNEEKCNAYLAKRSKTMGKMHRRVVSASNPLTKLISAKALRAYNFSSRSRADRAAKKVNGLFMKSGVESKAAASQELEKLPGYGPVIQAFAAVLAAGGGGAQDIQEIQTEILGNVAKALLPEGQRA